MRQSARLSPKRGLAVFRGQSTVLTGVKRVTRKPTIDMVQQGHLQDLLRPKAGGFEPRQIYGDFCHDKRLTHRIGCREWKSLLSLTSSMFPHGGFKFAKSISKACTGGKEESIPMRSWPRPEDGGGLEVLWIKIREAALRLSFIIVTGKLRLIALAFIMPTTDSSRAVHRSQT